MKKPEEKIETALALAQLGLTLLPMITAGTTELLRFIQSVRGAARQTGQWTEAQEEAYQASLLASATDPKHLPDPEG